jgi:hypothetical protein
MACTLGACDDSDLSAAPCTSTLDCRTDLGEQCLEGHCTLAICTSDDECSDDTPCRFGRCAAICVDGADCRDDEHCVPEAAAGFCLETLTPCSAPTDCEYPDDECVQTPVARCELDLEVSAYGPGLALTSGRAACDEAYQCLCVPDAASSVCFGLEHGYYSEAGCAVILEDAGC